MVTAVDVGATKVLVSQFNEDGSLSEPIRFSTPQDVQQFLRELQSHLDSLQKIDKIVIGLPGIIDDQGVLLRCGNLPWKHLAIEEVLKNRYNVPVHAENDAKLAALAEVSALPALPRMGLYITVSTGIGAGIVLDGILQPAFRNSEPGHMRLYFQNEWQQWQQFSSGKAIMQYFGKEAHEFTRDNEWQEVADRLSRGLFALIPTLQPDVIIFGGSVGNYFEHFDDLLRNKLQQLQPYIHIPTLVKARHPNQAVLFGCYQYALTHHLS